MKKNTYKEIKTDTELLTASMLRVVVLVVDRDPFGLDEVVDSAGIIEAYTPTKIKVNGEWYFRKYCSIRIPMLL